MLIFNNAKSKIMHMPKKSLLLLEIIFASKILHCFLMPKDRSNNLSVFIFVLLDNFLSDHAQECKKSICDTATDRVDETTFCTNADDMEDHISLV